MRRMVCSMTLLAALAAAGPAAAQPGEGLSLRPESVPWPRWQGRLTLSVTSPALPALDPALAGEPTALRGLSLMGDYYLSRPLLGEGQVGGLRATSALLIGPRQQALGAGSLGLPAGGEGLSVDRRLLGGAADADGASTALPYLGIGYTGLSSRGWGFSADLGVALTPSSPVRFGRAYPASPALDDALRELRLSPVLQLGVSYAF